MAEARHAFRFTKPVDQTAIVRRLAAPSRNTRGGWVLTKRAASQSPETGKRLVWDVQAFSPVGDCGNSAQIVFNMLYRNGLGIRCNARERALAVIKNGPRDRHS